MMRRLVRITIAVALLAVGVIGYTAVMARIGSGTPPEMGKLGEGADDGWSIDYDVSTPEADEPFFKLDRHEFKLGE